MKRFNTLSLTATAVAATLAATLAPVTVQAAEPDTSNAVTVYFTRHAEKKTTTTVVKNKAPNYSIAYDENGIETVTREPGKSDGDRLDEVCTGIDNCAEELNALGLKRADLLVDYFTDLGVVAELDAVYSSHKFRTFQTVEPTADAAGLRVVQLPGDETELSAGASASECPTIAAILDAPAGSTLLVGGHSGTLYDIMGDGNGNCDGLGLLMDSDPSSEAFPKRSDGRVRDFGDIWKVTVDADNDQAMLISRVRLDFVDLEVVDSFMGTSD